MTRFLQELQKAQENRTIPDKVASIFLGLYNTYNESLSATDANIADYEHFFLTILENIKEQVASPYSFEDYHRAVTTPFNYYTFGVEFLRPLVDLSKSKIIYLEHVEKMRQQIEAGENVVLLANHQTESDPQLISVILEWKNFEDLAREMIFVAGDRVVTDPLAVPFSLGRNLLCIYSKKYIDSPPEKREEKLRHNKRVMIKMSQLFKEGGKCVFVAPSGGR